MVFTGSSVEGRSGGLMTNGKMNTLRKGCKTKIWRKTQVGEVHGIGIGSFVRWKLTRKDGVLVKSMKKLSLITLLSSSFSRTSPEDLEEKVQRMCF